MQDQNLNHENDLLSKLIRYSTLLTKLAFGGLITVGLFWYIIPSLVMLSYPTPFPKISPYFLLFGIAMISASVYFGFLKSQFRFSILILFGLGYLVLDLLWNDYIDEFKHYLSFPGITIASTFVGVFIIGCGIIGGILYLILATISKIKTKKKSLNQIKQTDQSKLRNDNLKQSQRQKRISLGVFLLFLISTSVTLALEFNVLQIKETVIIDPGDHQVELAFWDPINPNRYSDFQKQELNDYNVTIIAYDLFRLPVDFSDAQFNASRDFYINSCKYWRDNYPQVNIMPAIIGMPGTFQWDGNANYSIWLTKEVINMTLEENLTNVIGFNTDQEFPDKHDFEEPPQVNRTRNQEATKLWQDFMDEFYTLYGDRFEFQTTFSMESVLDIYDRDDDLDITRMNNVLPVNYTEYAPMIYTASGDADPDYDSVNVNPMHSELYLDMMVLNESLYRAGHGGKIGIYLGITGKSFLSNHTENILDGESVGYGFDGLVMQAKIAMHFGCQRISTFVLNTLKNGDGEFEFFGAYTVYGDDFISRYWDALNGPNVEGFEFELYYLHNLGSDFQADLLFGNLIYLFILVELIIAEIFIAFSWKKEQKR